MRQCAVRGSCFTAPSGADGTGLATVTHMHPLSSCSRKSPVKVGIHHQRGGTSSGKLGDRLSYPVDERRTTLAIRIRRWQQEP
eukprot:1896898-Pyramimonas_sp.AAC.1